MPAPEHLLAEMADHPPIPPTPVARIRARARRRVRRRRALGATAIVVAVLAVGAGVAAVASDDPADDVTAGPGETAATTSDAPPTTTSTADGPAESLTLRPADGLVDGTEVAITLDEDATGEVVVAQCATEVRDVPPGDTDAVMGWCGGVTYDQVQPGEPLSWTVQRVLHTVDGPVDCAAPDRCIVVVRVGGPTATDDRYAVLRFREDLPVVQDAEVVVDGDDGTVGDGDRLLLTFRGVETGEDISIAQCIPDDAAEGDRCSSARSLWTSVQDGPETQLAFTAFHDVLVDPVVGDESYDLTWAACTPCELVVSVGERHGPIAVLPLAMEPTDSPIRPSVSVDPGGPVAVGSTVAVAARGLQPGSQVGVGWCPMDRVRGGGDPACRGSDGWDAEQVRVADDGSLVLDGLVVPEPDTALPYVDCAQPGVCGVGLDADDMFSVMAIEPMQITA